MLTLTRNTIDHLRLCQQARAQGYPVAYTTDSAWLVHQAINRRAGWPDDPGCSRGSCTPVRAHAGMQDSRRDRQGYAVGYRVGSARFVSTPSDTLVYPRKAQGEVFGHLRTLARKINTPRLIVRLSELGEWRAALVARMPNRFTTQQDI